MDTLKSIAIYAATTSTIYALRSSLIKSPHSPLSLYMLGGFSTLLCLYVLPLRYNLSSPWLAEWSRRRLKQANAAKRNRNNRQQGQDEFSRYEKNDVYGLEHAFINMELEPRTMWANVGYWKVPHQTSLKALHVTMLI